MRTASMIPDVTVSTLQQENSFSHGKLMSGYSISYITMAKEYMSLWNVLVFSRKTSGASKEVVPFLKLPIVDDLSAIREVI
jgi:hypothetical protein